MKSKSDEQLKFKSQMPIFVHAQTAWLEAFIDAVQGQFCCAHRSKGSRAQVSFNWGPFFHRRICQYFLFTVDSKKSWHQNYYRKQLYPKPETFPEKQKQKNTSGFGGVGLSSRKKSFHRLEMTESVEE